MQNKKCLDQELMSAFSNSGHFMTGNGLTAVAIFANARDGVVEFETRL